MVKPKAKMPRQKRKNFSSFNLTEAYKQLKIQKILPWSLEAIDLLPSDFFRERLERLQRHFDLRSCEESKKLLIDAFCEEALESFPRLKIWKGANLESDTTVGVADYLVAEHRGYLESPFLCVVEAKKDDFEQGLAQCLVEMQACQWSNHQLSQGLSQNIDILGIVTNGQGWVFYKLDTHGKVYETLPYALLSMESILGALHYIFGECDRNLVNHQ